MRKWLSGAQKEALRGLEKGFRELHGGDCPPMDWSSFGSFIEKACARGVLSDATVQDSLKNPLKNPLKNSLLAQQHCHESQRQARYFEV